MTITEKIALAKSIIEKNKGKFITIEFIKKDGTLRKMQCHRSKVLESTITGNNPEITAKRKETLKSKNMITAEELLADKTYQFRTVNLETIQRIAANGVSYNFN